MLKVLKEDLKGKVFTEEEVEQIFDHIKQVVKNELKLAGCKGAVDFDDYGLNTNSRLFQFLLIYYPKNTPAKLTAADWAKLPSDYFYINLNDLDSVEDAKGYIDSIMPDEISQFVAYVIKGNR